MNGNGKIDILAALIGTLDCQEKPFLRQVYHEWYSAIVAACHFRQEAVVELDAGGGFMSDLLLQVMQHVGHYDSLNEPVTNGKRDPFNTTVTLGQKKTSDVIISVKQGGFYRSCPLRASRRHHRNDRAVGYSVVTVRLYTHTPRAILDGCFIMGTSD